jgi:methionyl-tRNA formyltransferase
MPGKTVVIASHRPWHQEKFKTWQPPKGFEKVLITTREELTVARLKAVDPLWIFFPHWSWMIPAEIHDAFTCIMFHPGDVPFGRGGSPVQNLIVRGIYQTQLSAFRVVAALDSGDVYLKRPLDLSHGSAEEIFASIAELTFKMIDEIIRTNPAPQPQSGEVVVWKRRRPEESCIPDGLSARQLYDFIRMLDADGYPRAFVNYNGSRIEFHDAKLDAGRVSAKSTWVTPA